MFQQNENGNLAYDFSDTFYTTAVPTGSTQATVSTSTQAVSLSVTWKSS